MSIKVLGGILCKSRTILFPFNARIGSNFHSSARNPSVWEDSTVAPVADREYYFQNPPVEGDAMYTMNVRAAPTRNYYSVFYDELLERFEKMVLKRGRGDLAYRIVNGTMREIKLTQLTKYHNASEEEKENIETNPIVIFHQALQNASPAMGLQSMTKGGAAFQVPIPLSDRKKFSMAAKWILGHCRSGKPNTPMPLRLAKEILAAYENEGAAVKKKKDLHRQIVANRAYIHMRWE